MIVVELQPVKIDQEVRQGVYQDATSRHYIQSSCKIVHHQSIQSFDETLIIRGHFPDCYMTHMSSKGIIDKSCHSQGDIMSPQGQVGDHL